MTGKHEVERSQEARVIKESIASIVRAWLLLILMHLGLDFTKSLLASEELTLAVAFVVPAIELIKNILLYVFIAYANLVFVVMTGKLVGIIDYSENNKREQL